MYNEKVMDHFTNPRNIGYIHDAHGVGDYGDPDCGDQIIIYLQVNRGVIKDIKFKIFGCSTLIATTSMLTEMVMGKPLEEARKITGSDIVQALEGLPEDKAHCAKLSITALHYALRDYEKKKSLGWART